MVILQELSQAYDELRKKDNRFLPDGKAQITGKYENDKLVGIKAFTICYQNTEEEREETDKILVDIVEEIIAKYGVKVEEYLINPTGRFCIGGFTGDAGLTGRKIVVDSYQSFANVGGGAFSGKDPTKVDRSGAYKAREIAKDIVKNGDYNWCSVQLSYAIGKEEPLAIYISTDKGDVEPSRELFEQCKPRNIIKDLGLKDTCYEDRAKFGHFRD
jgi:S-adenosylmethionine synthetase